MAEQKDWEFPVEMRPRPEDWRFDLETALDAVVLVRSEIPEDAFTAPILGTERAGNGVVIRDDGLVLDRKSTRLNSSHLVISYAVFCLKKKKKKLRYRYIDVVYQS